MRFGKHGEVFDGRRELQTIGDRVGTGSDSVGSVEARGELGRACME